MSKWYEPVYIGKDSGNGVAICKVLSTDIATGDVKVFNRETQKVEVIPFEGKRTLFESVRRLALDTQHLDCGY